MQTLNIKNLYFKYPTSATPIFENVDLEFHLGWSAIVGANGSGKSTLLKIISKELKSETALIKGNELVYYSPQNTEFPPQELEEFMMTFRSKAFKIRDLLNIEDSWLGRWEDLSHGERKRLQIATALFLEPDIFLLDEPTNHLDSVSKGVVLESLKSFKGIGILVSHDRELLNALCTNTVIIKNSEVKMLRVNYSTAIREEQQKLAFSQRVQEQQNDEMKKLKNIIQSQKEKISKSKKRLSKRGLSVQDSDAREKINGAILTGRDKNEGQLLKRIQSKHEQLESSSVKLEKSYEKGILFEVTRSKKLFPVVLEKGIVEITSSKKVHYPRLTVEEHDKIGIIGENGSGKSTFLNHHLLSNMRFNAEYLYIPQELKEEESKKLFKEILELDKEEKGEIFTIIRRLSSDPKLLMQSAIPSPGETRKLLIAKGLLTKPSLIVLDEPTNHMDIDSIIALESALKEYEGTLVVISHDKVFLKNLTTKIWSFEKKEEESYEVTEIF